MQSGQKTFKSPGTMTGLLLGGLMGLSMNSSVVMAGEPLKVGQQASQQVEKPAHGQSMTQVEEKFGTPVQRVDAIGEPPITRWEYSNFTVYFEHDKVIHAVTHRS